MIFNGKPKPTAGQHFLAAFLAAVGGAGDDGAGAAPAPRRTGPRLAPRAPLAKKPCNCSGKRR